MGITFSLSENRHNLFRNQFINVKFAGNLVQRLLYQMLYLIPRYTFIRNVTN